MSDRPRDIDVIGLLGPLRRYALSLTRHPADAEDLVHDALLRALERREQFRSGAHLRPWLMSILHNGFVDRLRTRRAEAVRNAEIGLRADPSAAASQDSASRLADVRRAFMTLPDEQRAALHLVTVEGLSYEEAAASLGVPVGTLVSRLSRARARLRAIDEGTADGEGGSSNIVSLRRKEARMHRSPDPITEADCAAYVDGELGTMRRIEVEAHLAERPAEAARVMADLRARDELRLALSCEPLPVSVATNELAGRLERSLKRRGVARRFSRAAALVLLLGAGWIAHAEFNALSIRQSVASVPPPAFVADAVRAHGTSELRAAMNSQPESGRYDPAEILSATAIRVPRLPKGWTVTDVQLFPSTFGPSLEMSLSTEAFGTLSLFAVRPGSFDVLHATTVAEGEATAAYWQVGEVAYALVSTGADRRTLEHEAASIEASLH